MSDPLDRPYHEGLQSERTALSWQRTTLAFAVGFLVAARLLMDYFGILSFLVAAVGLVITAALFAIGYRRYRSTHRILIESAGERVPLNSAAPLFMWTAVVFCLAVFGLVFVIILALGR
ncbi:MAG: DUF202 domain-containing protein [Lacisediminihabitans sp.]